MRVLLINPPLRDFYNTAPRRQPLGLLYLAAALMDGGYEVQLIDAGASRQARRLPVPEELKATTPSSDGLDSSPFKLFGRFYHFGPPYEEIVDRAATWAPHVIGISSLFSAYAQEVVSLVAALREAVPSALYVLGGCHPSSLPHLVLRNQGIDFIILGEGETAGPALIRAWARGEDPLRIPGVGGRLKGGDLFVHPPRFHQEIDTILPPARTLLNLDAYRVKGLRMAHILSSRGCPVRCAFCSAHLTSGPRFRARHPGEVVKEMLACRHRFGMEAFDFEDDNLSFDPTRAEALMERIIRAFGEDKLWLEAKNGISMHGLSSRLLHLMRTAGFRNLGLSPLTAQPSLRSRMNRPSDDPDGLSVARMAARIGFRVTAYLMIGYPGQTLVGMMETLQSWAREPLLLAPSVFYPAPGARIQEEAFGFLQDADEKTWSQMRSSLFPEVPGGLRRSKLRTVFWLTRVVNFARALESGRDPRALRLRCRSLFERSCLRFRSRDGTLHVQAPHALDPETRGATALAAFLARKKPHGIRLNRRGSKGEAWSYQLYPLEKMIKDPEFYNQWGIPGFEVKELWREASSWKSFVGGLHSL
jgi:radical SAM superfamily enzyme YgiQ (UPF0313 family)